MEARDFSRVRLHIGYGDKVYPSRVIMDFPVLLQMDSPKVYAYSIYSVIAEKFEAFTSLGLINGRYKDFYDIYILAKRFDLIGIELQEAINETFMNRNTSFTDIIAFSDSFINNKQRQARWNSFINKKKAMEKVDLEETISYIKKLLIPIIEANNANIMFAKVWSHEIGQWENWGY